MNEITIATQEDLDKLEDFKEATVVKIIGESIVISKNLKNGSYRLRGYASAKLYGDSSAILYDNSSAILCSTSSAILYDNSSAKLFNTSSAILYANSSAKLFDNSSARLYDNSSVVLRNYSSAKLFNISSAKLFNNSSAALYDNSSAKLYDNSKATLLSCSSAKLLDNSRVYLYDNSSADLYNYSKADIYGRSTVTLFQKSIAINFSSSANITAYEQATILTHKDETDYTCYDAATVIELEWFYEVDFKTWLERGYVVADGIYRKYKSHKEIAEDITLYETDKGFVARQKDTFAHGETEQEALLDLKYKTSDRDNSQFKEWAVNDLRSLWDMIFCYRSITGACKQGVKDFVKQIDNTKKYSINDVITLTKGQYGNEQFKTFFNIDK